MNEFVLNGLVKRRAQIAHDIENTHELRRHGDLQQRDIPFLQDFVDRYEGRDIQLPLPIRWSDMAFQRNK
jgi:hypothetical protein